jgi:NAD-dependent deacetylase
VRIDRHRYRRVVVLTGAGVSAASGLRTFRGPGGIWKQHDVERLGHVDALLKRPAETWTLFGSMREPVRTARPNAAHVALAKWEAELAPDHELVLVTQNVDGLHQAAGSRHVCEIHGNVMYTRCTNPECTLERYWDENAHARAVPTCPLCAAPLRPDVVLFGEDLPARAAWTAKKALRDCDLFLAVGTSGTVSPAAGFVRGAEFAGARTILVNLEPMLERNPAFQEEYLGKAEDVLPGLLGLAP